MFISRIFNVCKQFCKLLIHPIALILVDGWYGGYWKVREVIINASTSRKHRILRKLINIYQDNRGFWIGEHASFGTAPVFPHGMSGIFISDMAKIGKNSVIFHQVTIGSNTIKNHPRCGAPTIGDNVYIGAGAKLIGNIKIGDNCRIGANCVVVKDLPPNSTAVLGDTRIIVSTELRNNDFVYGKDFQNKQDNKIKL